MEPYGRKLEPLERGSPDLGAEVRVAKWRTVRRRKQECVEIGGDRVEMLGEPLGNRRWQRHRPLRVGLRRAEREPPTDLGERFGDEEPTPEQIDGAPT